ncbi:MAG: DUF389 domain-containing protein, partial [Anaerovibrio sp.]|nr:DUF389 domain-containing protein [Anaerovibrio sp.]
ENDQKLLENIRKKAPILFPSFEGIEGAAVASRDKDGKVSYRNFIAVITLKSVLSAEEQSRLQNWLNAESDLPVTFITK